MANQHDYSVPTGTGGGHDASHRKGDFMFFSNTPQRRPALGWLVVGTIVAMLGFGCGGGGGGGDTGGGASGTSHRFLASIPDALIQHGVNGGALVVVANVAGAGQVDMALNATRDQVAGWAAASSPTQDVEFIFYVQVGTTRTEIARASVVADFTVQPETSIPLAALTISLSDLDGDGFGNLSELLYGSVVNDPLSHPTGIGTRKSANYLFVDDLGIFPSVRFGPGVQASSTNYTLN